MPTGDTDIRDGQAYLQTQPDWHAIIKSLEPNVTPSDVDHEVERKGNFLRLEAKSYDAPFKPGSGQGRQLLALAKRPGFKVVIFWFTPRIGPVTHYQILGINKKRVECEHEWLDNYFDEWWTGATNNPFNNEHWTYTGPSKDVWTPPTLLKD